MEMMRFSFVFLSLIFPLFCWSQIVFEPGYFVDNDGQRIECLIRNVDWLDNPSGFDYKLSETAEKQRATIEDVQEFGFEEHTKYVRATVDVNRSAQDLEKLNRNSQPIMAKETLFLEVLIGGEATLYEYIGESLQLFFFQSGESAIEPLVYVMFLTDGGLLSHNRQYQQQIWNALKCSSISASAIERLDYKKNELKNLFVLYNQCKGGTFTMFEEKRPKRNFLRMSVRPGLNFSSLAIQRPNRNSVYNQDFDGFINFRLGLEVEFILPFNKDKWSIIIEPTYRKLSQFRQINEFRSLGVSYASIELPVGVRYYFYFKDQSAFFLNGMVIPDFSSGQISLDGGGGPNIEPVPNFGLGGGFRYRNRLSVEFRYHSNRELFRNLVLWTSNYSSFSFIIGYRFL